MLGSMENRAAVLDWFVRVFCVEKTHEPASSFIYKKTLAQAAAIQSNVHRTKTTTLKCNNEMNLSWKSYAQDPSTNGTRSLPFSQFFLGA